MLLLWLVRRLSRKGIGSGMGSAAPGRSRCVPTFPVGGLFVPTEQCSIRAAVEAEILPRCAVVGQVPDTASTTDTGLIVDPGFGGHDAPKRSKMLGWVLLAGMGVFHAAKTGFNAATRLRRARAATGSIWILML